MLIPRWAAASGASHVSTNPPCPWSDARRDYGRTRGADARRQAARLQRGGEAGARDSSTAPSWSSACASRSKCSATAGACRTSSRRTPRICSSRRATSSRRTACGSSRCGAATAKDGSPKCSGPSTSRATGSRGCSRSAATGTRSSRSITPRGATIFESFARGVNASIQKAIDENKIPVEFQIMGFRPQPMWTARTLLTRMPGWTLSRNASSEVQRALDVKTMGIAKVQELKPTDPEKAFAVPEGLDLADIDAAILGVTRDANNLRWNLAPQKPTTSAARDQAPQSGALASFLTPNPWLARAGSRQQQLGDRRQQVHDRQTDHRQRSAPRGRQSRACATSSTSTRRAGTSSAPPSRVCRASASATTIASRGDSPFSAWISRISTSRRPIRRTPNRYRADGQWRDMDVQREVIWVRGQNDPVTVDLKFTRHGPVLHENTARNRAYALRWVGAEPGGAGYLGSLNVLQTKNWKEFNDALPKAWYIPSHSLVYADVEGNYGYIGVAQTPVRKNWDGLLPVPGQGQQVRVGRLRALRHSCRSRSTGRRGSTTRRTTTSCRRSCRAIRSRSATSTARRTVTTACTRC